MTYNAEHTENIDGWSADNVYGGWPLSQEVRDTSAGKAHQEYNCNIHISNAEQCNCLGFGTRINVATGTTHEPNGSLPPHNRSFVTDITAHLEYHHHRIQMFLDLSVKMKLTKECWVAVQGLGRKTPVTLLVPIFSVLRLC